MAFELKPLPFPKESLGPTMSTSTLEHHHEKHHAAYVKKLNELIRGTKFESSSDLESIIRATARGQGKDKKNQRMRDSVMERNQTNPSERARQKHEAKMTDTVPQGEARMRKKS